MEIIKIIKRLMWDLDGSVFIIQALFHKKKYKSWAWRRMNHEIYLSYIDRPKLLAPSLGYIDRPCLFCPCDFWVWSAVPPPPHHYISYSLPLSYFHFCFLQFPFFFFSTENPSHLPCSCSLSLSSEDIVKRQINESREAILHQNSIRVVPSSQLQNCANVYWIHHMAYSNSSI